MSDGGESMSWTEISDDYARPRSGHYITKTHRWDFGINEFHVFCEEPAGGVHDLIATHRTYEAAMNHCDELRLAWTRGRMFGMNEMAPNHIS